MIDLSRLTVQIGSIADGRWIAATGSAPFFCLEAHSEEAVIDLARRALRFYSRVIEANGGNLPEGRDYQPDIPHVTKTVSAEDLIAA